MKRLQYIRLVFAVTLLALALPAAYGQGGKDAKKKEYAFQGKIEKVNADGKTIAVNGADIPGWMSAMTMDYTVDKPEVLKTLKVGDQITAKVYEGDFKVLYDVKVAPAKTEPAKTPEPAKKK
jgi:Cu/Ag efflux protein CusF